MNIEKLCNYLESWIGVETWNTEHPLDNERFHKSLQNIFKNLGTQISYDDFYEAIERSVEDLYPHYNADFKITLIKSYSLRAATIAEYVSDIKNI